MQTLKPIRGVMIVFIILSALFITQRVLLQKWGFDRDLLIIGNVVLFLITLLSFKILSGSFKASPHAFVRSVYTSFIVKFFAIAIAAFVYILIAKNGVNKPSLLTCMGLYIVYTTIEVSALTRMLKQKTNA